MDRETKEKIGLSLAFLIFFIEGGFLGQNLFGRFLSPSDTLTYADVAVKGLSTGATDTLLNFGNLIFILSANLVAIALVFKFALKEEKGKHGHKR
jgi:hypothetical protein